MKARSPAGWEHFEHQADIGVRGWGATPAAALEQIALAMIAVIADPAKVEPGECIRIDCEAPNMELLVVNWLNAILAEMSIRRCLFGRFEVQLNGNRLAARGWGEQVDIARHQPAVEVKGATFCALAMERRRDGAWQAQCVVDV